MKLGALIDDRHTARDWGLGWVGVSLTAPETNTIYQEIPGRDGPLDLTEAIRGEPTYRNRSLSLICDLPPAKFGLWHRIYSEVCNYCHGQARKVILDTDQDFFYYGRLAISSEKESVVTASITFTLDAAPYKLERTSSTEDWRWDSFSFETGIIRDYRSLVVNGSRALRIHGRRMRVIPIFICSKAMSVTYAGKQYALSAGKNKINAIWLKDGENELTFTGSGTVTVEYRGGML